MLNRIDSDRNGTISGTLRRADAARCLREMGLQLRAGELSMVMDEFDRSGEGLVDYDEMLKAIERWDHSAEWAASSAAGAARRPVEEDGASGAQRRHTGSGVLAGRSEYLK